MVQIVLKKKNARVVGFPRGKKVYEKSAHFFLVIIFVSMVGCASTHKTTRTETTVTYPNEPVGVEGERTVTTTVVTSDEGYEQGAVEKSETTTETTETKSENPGVISSTFHAIGYVLVLPFLIIGGVLRILFGG